MRRTAFLLAAGAAALVCAQAPAQVRAAPVWLCHPDQKANPCTRSLNFTAVNGNLALKGYGVGVRRAQPVDCFYVYPSVSTENRGNSDLKPGIEETDTAWLQASWFSPFCRVFAPMYRQVTTHGDGNPFHGNPAARVRRRARRVAGVPREGQQGPRLRADRPLRGRVSAQAADPGADRGQPGRPPQARVGGAARRRTCSSATARRRTATSSTCRRARRRIRPAASSPTRRGTSRRRRTRRSSARTPSQHVLCVNPAAPKGGPAAVTPMFLTSSFNEMGGVSPQLLFAVNTEWVSYPTSTGRSACGAAGWRGCR